MDHANTPCSTDCHALRRKVEPFVFFFGTLALVLLAIALIVRESRLPVGPGAPQPIQATQPGH